MGVLYLPSAQCSRLSCRFACLAQFLVVCPLVRPSGSRSAGMNLVSSVTLSRNPSQPRSMNRNVTQSRFQGLKVFLSRSAEMFLRRNAKLHMNRNALLDMNKNVTLSMIKSVTLCRRRFATLFLPYQVCPLH